MKNQTIQTKTNQIAAVMKTDRNLASAPKTNEVVKISFPQGLFLIAIS